MRGVHLLNVVYQSNQARSDPLPDSEFYNKSVSQQADLAYEYFAWHRMQVSNLQGLVQACASARGWAAMKSIHYSVSGAEHAAVCVML